ncbi:hypothetical protein Q6D67_16540 [Haliea sp. E1-2-M8]|uniref:hypothetical protein n=1 Tax=Haliea sp. E1-2-M8 TaxID=3064706 RepID=UPI00271BFAB8|nr:hypothetical protein [Haliea sp. E1-2-M8]MDO8863315.1 hypothetical protein [Haliea sp. E1-2-M8]
MKTLTRVAITIGLGLGVANASQANFFKDLVDSVQRTAENTAKDVVIQTTRDTVRNMIIGYTTVQVKSDREVSSEFEKETGSLPVNPKVSAYRSEVLPGTSVRPGTEVRVKSHIEVVPGTSGTGANIEEKMTIWDNDDNSVALNSMTKAPGSSTANGGAFTSEFTFKLPEGLPQGVYPVSTHLLLNGEQVGDQRHGLQLVLQVDVSGAIQLAQAGY